MEELTPMMKQYREIKDKNKEYILFYRLGDFYEMFFEDALLVSAELELTLTGRDCGLAERAPMCGVPFHSAEGYIARLVKNGHKVAICEQVEDPKKAKGLVKREIVRIVTPGTVIDASMLTEDQNNFLGGIYAKEGQIGVCFVDISTGEVFATGSTDYRMALSEFSRFSPREVLVGGDAAESQELISFLKDKLNALVEPMPSTTVDDTAVYTRITSYFSSDAYNASGLSNILCAQYCLNGMLLYLEQTQQPSLANLNSLQVYRNDHYMELDLVARKNLELCETIRSSEKKGSLLWVLDQTKTAMGSRMIRQWIEKPLYNPLQIVRRQTAVAELSENFVMRSALCEALSKVFDMERLIGRIVYGTANCRDLRALYSACEYLPSISQTIEESSCNMLRDLYQQIDLLEDIRALISLAIVEEPPATVREGGMIQSGYHDEIDYLHELASGGKSQIAQIEQKEKEETGIKNLKIGYNRVFGYYIEVSKSNTNLVPQHYIRKQTLANGERYITEELKKLESTVLGAQERLTVLEYEVFVSVRERIAEQVHRVQATAHAVATLDVLASLAEVAVNNHYTCPVVDMSGSIEIKEGRHPVVEKVLSDALFIANDTILDQDENRFSVITGPNMAGKSTYMRQVAIIAIMAQMGAFVPASKAHIGVVDRIFTRVGASDDLSSGQSTFMVEMSEVADLLTLATKNSLLILDEIGRGTSTYDGMSIARAVIEYIADKKKLGARTLFATHYHELTELEDIVPGVKNYNIAVKKRGDDITFLRKIVRGGADDSYGIEVAKLAGVPAAVIKRAKVILADIESHGQVEKPTKRIHIESEEQGGLLDLSSTMIVERLKAVQVDTMTPIEAMNALYELKKML